MKILTVGHACLDIVHTVPRIPGPNTKVDSHDLMIQIGGNAANCARTISNLGIRVDLCTVLGSEDHPFTRILVSLLRSHGIGMETCRFDNTQPCPSSTIMVTPDGERSIVNWQGESLRNSVSLPSTVKGYSMLHVDTYRLPMAKQVLEMARADGVASILDVDAPPDDVGMIPRADYVWFSHEAWKKHRIPLRDLHRRFNAVVGVTNGPQAVLWIDQSGTEHGYDPPRVVALNTLGAGDVFRASFGLSIARGKSIHDAVEQACVSACDHISNLA